MTAQTFFPLAIAHFDPAQNSLPGKLIALLGESTRVQPLILQSLFLRVARGERVALVIGDNHFDAYHLARLARAHEFDPAVLLPRVELSRPFTCYQLHHRIHTLATERQGKWSAVYVMGLLDTFCDEDVRVYDAERLLQSTLGQLKTIAHNGLPILVSMAVPRQPERAPFVERVKRAADAYWQPAPVVLEQFNAQQLQFAGMR